MADLIDLTSPEDKKLQPALASPLIPSPENDSPKPGGFNLSDSRKSIDNNPFDMVHRKTAEYVSKLSDPFETVFHKATSEPDKSQEVADDLFLRKRRYSDILKLNKTLDESTTNASRFIDTSKTPKASIASRRIVENDETEVPSILVEPPSPGDNLSLLDISAMNDSFRSLSDRLSFLKKLPGTSGTSDILEKSLLSNSAMNDTLSTSENSAEDGVIKSIVSQTTSMFSQNGPLEFMLNDQDKTYKMRRSFSQGDRLSPRKFRQRSLSIVDGRKTSLFTDNSVASILFEDPLNLGFMSRGKNDYSIGNDLSELSAITRLDSVNSASCLTSVSSDIANKGFIDSHCGHTIGGSEKTRSKASDSSMQDLIAKFKSLRSKSMIECDFRKKSIESKSKLEDDEGSDSVFLDDNKKSSIFSEANILAKTFEDLATKSTKSSGSGEDLLNTRVPSNFNLSSETSAASYNMSDVPASPSKLQANTNIVANSLSPSKTSTDSTKKEATVNLLRDLEKVVQTENNPEIMKLLKNLEKALGFTGENNLDLLTMCRQAQSKNDEKLKVNLSKVNEQTSSQKDPKATKMSPQKFNKSPMKKSPKKMNDKSLEKVKIAKTSPKANKIQAFEVKDKNTEENYNESESNNVESEKSSEDNTEPPHDLVSNGENINVNTSTSKALKSLSSPPQDSFSTQKLILDIQLALGKLLEDCKDEPALVLENLNKVLNPKETIKQPIKSPVSSRKSGLSYRTMKSLSNPPELAKNHQKTPVKSLSPRRRSSISQSKSSHTKRVDSPKKDAAKRRNTSDPGIEVGLEKKQSDVSLKIKSTVPVMDKVKFKKKNDNPMATKRGPMKALVPLGNMQRGGSKSSQCMPPGTPTKRERIPSPLKIATSTPDPSPIVLGKKTTRSKPVASSTPDVVSKFTNDRSHVPESPKNTMSWNISPVTPNVKGEVKNFFDNTATPNKGECTSQTPRKMNKSLDRNIKGPSPLTGGGNRIKEKIIHGRRSEPLQLLSPRVDKGGLKAATASPLKEKNMIKPKPLNLNNKFRRRSGSLGGWEKENKV